MVYYHTWTFNCSFVCSFNLKEAQTLSDLWHELVVYRQSVKVETTLLLFFYSSAIRDLYANLICTDGWWSVKMEEGGSQFELQISLHNATQNVINCTLHALCAQQFNCFNESDSSLEKQWLSGTNGIETNGIGLANFRRGFLSAKFSSKTWTITNHRFSWCL